MSWKMNWLIFGPYNILVIRDLGGPIPRVKFDGVTVMYCHQRWIKSLSALTTYWTFVLETVRRQVVLHAFVTMHSV